MSLSCYECLMGSGAFDVSVLFSPTGKFPKRAKLSGFQNLYTCCALPDDFKAVKKSRFAVVRQKNKQTMWSMSDDPTIAEMQVVLVDEAELKQKLPRIYEWLANGKWSLTK